MLIRSTDSGAPALNGQAGSLYAVMKWALPQLGWTIEFDNATDVIAFRNSTLSGTGNYLRVDDNPANHVADARSAALSSFETMSDIDAGTNQTGGTSCLIQKSATANSAARPWAIVGDERYFWWLADTGSSGRYMELYLGDIESDTPGDSGAFLIQGHNMTDPTGGNANTSVLPQSTYGGNVALADTSALRSNIAATVINITARFGVAQHVGSLTGTSGLPGGVGTYPDPAAGGIRVTDIPVIEQVGGINRGRLRGAVRALNNISSAFNSFDLITAQPTSRGARNLVFVRRSASFSGSGGLGGLLFDAAHEGPW